MMYKKFEEEMQRRAEHMLTWGKPIGIAFPTNEEDEDVFFIYEDTEENWGEQIPITLVPELLVQLRKILKQPIKVLWYDQRPVIEEDEMVVLRYQNLPFAAWEDSSYSNCYSEFLKPFMYGCWE